MPVIVWCCFVSPVVKFPVFLILDDSYDETFYDSKGPFFISRKAVNWTEAKETCEEANLELASVISEEEQETLSSFIRRNELVPKDQWSGYWLSGMRHDDGDYYWETTGTELSRWGWCWGEPSHAYGKEDCIELKWDTIKLGWNDYFCDELRKYICQVPRKFKPKAIKKKFQTPDNELLHPDIVLPVHQNIVLPETELLDEDGLSNKESKPPMALDSFPN